MYVNFWDFTKYSNSFIHESPNNFPCFLIYDNTTHILTGALKHLECHPHHCLRWIVLHFVVHLQLAASYVRTSPSCKQRIQADVL
jgi:hypothetical protein